MNANSDTKITLHTECWKSIIPQLKERFIIDTSRIPSDGFASKVLVNIVVNKLDGGTAKKEAFEETVKMADSSNVDVLYTCFQRMADLCQALDYSPAGVWLGLFCEEVLCKYEDAQYWYNKAASLGNGLGMYRVGLLYLNRKVPLPKETSLKRCFTDAAANGVSEANDILKKYFAASNQVRNNGNTEQGSNPGSNWLLVAEKLLDDGRKKGYITSYEFPQIPELLTRADLVCKKILYETIALRKKYPNISLISGCFSCSAFAGMGAVYHWHTDWPTLSKNGIFETMIQERGFNEMDEYVLDTIGIPFGSPKATALSNYLYHTLSMYCASLLDLGHSNQSEEILIRGAKAMYCFGTVFEMNRLGMK